MKANHNNFATALNSCFTVSKIVKSQNESKSQQPHKRRKHRHHCVKDR